MFHFPSGQKTPKTPEMQVTRKIFTRVAANISFNPFLGDILFSSLVSFALFVFLFFCMFACFLKLEIYSDTYSTMRTDEWKKIVHPTNFQKQEYLFLIMQTKQNWNYAKMRSLVSKNLVNNWLKKCCDFAWNLSENILLKNIFDSIDHYHDVIKNTLFC